MGKFRCRFGGMVRFCVKLEVGSTVKIKVVTTETNYRKKKSKNCMYTISALYEINLNVSTRS